MTGYYIFQLLLLSYLSVGGYRIIEYSYDDGSGSGLSDTETFLEGRQSNFLLNLISKTTVPTKNSEEEAISTLRRLQLMNKNVKIYSTNPGENITSLPNKSKRKLKGMTCIQNHNCKGTQICNIYTKKCERCRIEKEICRRSENCCGNKQCIWGRCIHRTFTGTEGSLCNTDKDCHKGLCCAREHGQSICKKYLAEGNQCELPHGGIIFSLSHSCPCAMGLNCRITSHKRRMRTCVK